MAKQRIEIGKWGKRLYLQLISLITFNSYFKGINFNYTESVGKRLCIPVLNCYSCPIGATACPIGTITTFAMLKKIPYYVIGFLGLMGLAVGRAFCGWSCPFGFLQDLLYRIRTRKLSLPLRFNWLKYALLAVLVIGLPLIIGGGKKLGAGDRIIKEGTGSIDYCGTVCPAGTLEAGLPALASDSEIRAKVYWRTYGKFGILVIVLGLAIVSRRSFCRSLCPLGALMALSTPISMLRLKTDQDKCTRCMKCVKVCPTHCRFVPEAAGKKETTAECVLCLDCVRNCPEAGALSATLAGKTISISQGKSSG
jgi:ferredoxin